MTPFLHTAALKPRPTGLHGNSGAAAAAFGGTTGSYRYSYDVVGLI